MNIVVFGATGPTGRLVVARALAAGHAVTAVARNPDAVQEQPGRLAVAAGDVRDAEAVARAVAGQEAVIAAYGVPYSRAPISVYSEGARNIVVAMRHHGVRRFAGVTSGGTNPRRTPGSPLLFEGFIKPVIGRTLYADMRRMEEVVMASGLDWTIARPATLVDERGTGGYREESGHIVPGAFATSRADLADFLVRAVGEGHHVGQALAVATPGVTLPWERYQSITIGLTAVGALATGALLWRRVRR